MSECGKPAEYVGVLVLQDRPRREHRGPFCGGCASPSWHRQFVSDRRAAPGEKCSVDGSEFLTSN